MRDFLTVLDVETTGLIAGKHRIVEVGAAVYDSQFNECASFSSLVNPGLEAVRNAEPKALEVHGIPPEEILAAEFEVSVAERLRRFFVRYRGTLHSWPVEFDRSFLALPPWSLERGWGECIKQAAFELISASGDLSQFKLDHSGRVRLKDAARYFGVTQEGAHRGLSDSRTAGKIFIEILRRRVEEASQDEARAFLEESQ